MLLDVFEFNIIFFTTTKMYSRESVFRVSSNEIAFFPTTKVACQGINKLLWALVSWERISLGKNNWKFYILVFYTFCICAMNIFIIFWNHLSDTLFFGENFSARLGAFVEQTSLVSSRMSSNERVEVAKISTQLLAAQFFFIFIIIFYFCRNQLKWELKHFEPWKSSGN